MEESFLHYKFPPWNTEQMYPSDAQDKLKKELSYSNNFTFDLLNLCRILNITPHPDLINLKSKEEIEKLEQQEIEPAAVSPRPGTTKSAKTPSKPAKPKALTIDDYIERGIYKIEDIDSLSIQRHLLDPTTVKLLTMTLPQSFIQNLTISGVHLTKESLHELSSCLQQYPFIKVLKIEWNPVNIYHTGKTPRPPTPEITEEEKKRMEEEEQKKKEEEEKKEEKSKKSEKKSMKEDKSKSKSKKDDKKSVKKGAAGGKGKKGKEEEKKEEEEEEKKEEPPPPPPEPPKPRHSFDSFFDAEDINNIPPKEGEIVINPTTGAVEGATATADGNNNIQQQSNEQKQGEETKKEEKEEEEFDPEKHMDDYSEIFAEFVDPMSPVEYLCLRGNKITSKGFKAICEKLKSSITITELNLFDNVIDDEGIEVLSEMIKYNRSLYSISLSHNRIVGSNLSKILSSFVPYSVEQKDDKAMRDKVISDTKNAYKELGALLKKRKAMCTSAKKPELDIPVPKMPDLGSVGKKDNMCPGNDTLHVIDLSYNRVTDENVRLFVDSLKDCFNHNTEVLPIALESLVLNENGLSEESMKLLEEGMKYVPEVSEAVENTAAGGKKGKSPRSPKS